MDGYKYWLVRYVPDTVHGEFVNVGIIVGAEGRDWAFRRAHSVRRANRLGGNVAQIEPWLSRITQSIADYQAPPLELFASKDSRPVDTSWAAHSRARLNNSLQLGEPTPIEAESAADAAELLFQILVGDDVRSSRVATRRRLVSELHRSYELIEATSAQVVQRPRARVGKQRGRFDFAVFGDEVDQLSQVWSFDVRDLDNLEQEMQSWSYLVTRLRADGGELMGRQGSLFAPKIDNEVEISVVYQEPVAQTSERQDLFLAAQESWAQLKVKAVPSTQLERVALQARELVLA
ncbi:MAG TPA: DUF3037 domain-containing protein [Galbitalea sp.]|jgi:hypothetical protein|nr:DUF3037 domain-containing protein [Galbitalea sp.]